MKEAPRHQVTMWWKGRLWKLESGVFFQTKGARCYANIFSCTWLQIQLEIASVDITPEAILVADLKGVE